MSDQQDQQDQQEQPKRRRGRPPKEATTHPTVHVHVRGVREAAWRNFVARAALENRPVGELLEEAIDEYLARRKWREFEDSRPVYE